MRLGLNIIFLVFFWIKLGCVLKSKKNYLINLKKLFLEEKKKIILV